MGHAIGIDLGTANVRTSIFRDGEAEIIPHEGDKLMPSYVAFTNTGRLVGAAAKEQATMNSKNTIFNALRFIGRKFSDAEIQQHVKDLPYQVIERSDWPAFMVQYRSTELVLTPIEILAMLLARARRDAEKYVGSVISTAVITIPAYFNFCQRQAIRDAALIAQITPLHLISAPVSICSMYAQSRRHVRGQQRILVADFGAGTIDVALAVVEAFEDFEFLEIKIEAMASDTFNGGEDIDSRLVRYIADLNKRRTGLDPMADPTSLSRLRIACEQAKCELSSQMGAYIKIDWPHGGYYVGWQISRKKLEECCYDIVRSSLQPIKRVLRDCRRVRNSGVAIVNMSGGSSRTPLVQSMLCSYLEGRELVESPLENAAASGAALFASQISEGTSSTRTVKMLLMDVVPVTIGIDIGNGKMVPLIKRNTSIPAKGQEDFTTLRDDQRVLPISVFEGERTRTDGNRFLGRMDLCLPPAPRGVPRVEVELQYDKDGRISISARDKDGGGQVEFYAADPDRLSGREVERMTAEARRFDAADELEEQRILAKDDLRSYVLSTINRIAPLQQKEAMTGTRSAEEVLHWLEENQNASAVEYLEHLNGLKATFQTSMEVIGASGADSVPTTDATDNQEPSFRSSPPEPESESDPDVGQSNTEAKHESQAGNREWKVPLIHGGLEEGNGEQMTMPSINPRSSSVPASTLQAERQSPESLIQDEAPLSEIKTTFEPAVDTSSIAPTPAAYSTTPALSRPQSSTPTSTARGMDELFPQSGQCRIIYIDADFSLIATYLSNIKHPSWSTVPRLYTILRLIDQLSMLDAFIGQGMTDIWIPFTQASLPSTLSPTARAQFLEHQNVVLSKSLLFEKNAERKHAHFGKDEPLPFQVIGKLGAGAHAQVDKVMSTVSCREYARKLFRRRRGVRQDAIKSFLVELQVLKKVQHRHCIELVQSYTDAKYFALIMSPVGQCNLYEYYSMSRDDLDKRSLLRSFLGCLANALQYIHSIKIRHRDIKPHNIIVKGDQVFLTDFGIALDWENLTRSTTTADSAKTLVYAAPEVVRFERRNTAADMWSLGCVFLEIVTVLKGETVDAMRAFFNERSQNHRFYANLEGIQDWVANLREANSVKDNTILEWVLGMLREKSEQRPTAATLSEEIRDVCAAESLQFCGLCCLEAVDSSGTEDEDEDGEDLWGRAAELALVADTASQGCCEVERD